MREAFPEQYAKVAPETFARALNAVEPSLIRVEADEVTYNLHIIVRFEMEKAIVNGDVAIESLPRLWNEKYQEYLGVKPPTDSEGVLQDIHWSQAASATSRPIRSATSMRRRFTPRCATTSPTSTNGWPRATAFSRWSGCARGCTASARSMSRRN